MTNTLKPYRWECPRCNMIVAPYLDKENHQCHPESVIKKIVEEADLRERRKNELPAM